MSNQEDRTEIISPEGSVSREFSSLNTFHEKAKYCVNKMMNISPEKVLTEETKGEIKKLRDLPYDENLEPLDPMDLQRRIALLIENDPYHRLKLSLDKELLDGIDEETDNKRNILGILAPLIHYVEKIEDIHGENGRKEADGAIEDWYLDLLSTMLHVSGWPGSKT